MPVESTGLGFRTWQPPPAPNPSTGTDRIRRCSNRPRRTRVLGGMILVDGKKQREVDR